MKSGKSYKRNLLLAATIVSLSVTMPMNVAYADNPTPTRGANAAYTITNGTSDNYNFTTSDGSTTSYYKTNLSVFNLLNNINDSTVWLEGTQENNNFSVVLPNNETRYFIYGYTKPDGWGDGARQTYDYNDNAAGNSSFYNNRTFNGLNSTVSGGAIDIQGKYPATTGSNLIGTMTADFINNSITNTDASEKGLGGALHIWGPYAGIETLNSNFINNHITYGTTKSGGGALAIGEGYNGGESTVGLINGNFINNYIDAPSYNLGGAIYYEGSGYGDGEITSIGQDPVHTTKFVGNHILGTGQGGAIYAVNKIGSIYADFIGNYIAGKSDNSRGGAITLSSTSDEKNVGLIVGDFIGNYITTSANNGSAWGGAIYNNNIVGSITGDFIGNYIESTYNDTYSGGKSVYGGAIYNTGTIGTNITGLTGNFIGNYANGQDVYGGAIYNTGTITNLNGKFIENDAYANIQYGYNAVGGAIANKSNGVIENISGDFIRNKAHTSYTSNSSMTATGGAIYNDGAKIGTINANFIENESQREAGAIYNSGYASSNKGIGTISGNFIKNKVTGEIARDTNGGAISNTGTIDSITDATFSNNSVASANGKNGYGGAIYNSYMIGEDNGYGFVDFSTGIIDSSFTGNTASTAGGAIYNTSDAKGINIIANTKNVEFSGNIAPTGASIYNLSADGTNITATGGNVTFTNNTPTNSQGYGIYSSASVNLAANDGYTVKIDDSIDIVNQYADLTINQGNFTGNVELNGKINFENSNSGIRVGFAGFDSGTLKLGATPANGTYQYLVNAGNYTLDLQNEHAGDNLILSQLSGIGEMKFNIDYDATANSMDKITVNAGSGTITLNAVNVINDNANFVDGTTAEYLDGTARGNITVISDAINSATDTGWLYVFTPTSTNGELSIARTIAYEGDLINAIQDDLGGTYHPTSFSLSDNFTANRNFGALSTENRDEFTIFGNNHTISGDNNTYTGIEVASGKTLNLDNVRFSNVKTYDVQNAGTLNLSGTNIINTITDAETPVGTTNITGGTTTIAANGSVTQDAINLQGGNLNVNAGSIINSDIFVDGTIDTTGRLSVINSTINGTIHGTFKGNTDGVNSTLFFMSNTLADNDLTLDSVNFESNSAIFNGGLFYQGSGDLTLNNNQFINNTSNQYGAMFTQTSGITSVTGATFKGNASIATSGNVYGGAISKFGSGTLTISDTIFGGTEEGQGNSAKSTSGNAYGGAIYQTGGSLSVTDTTFTGNSVSSTGNHAYGGAIYQENGTYSITGTKSGTGDNVTSTTMFINNIADGNDGSEGGAVYIKNTSGTIDGVVFKSNEAVNGQGGGAIALESGGTHSIKNTAFLNNVADVGAAIYNNETTSLTIENSLFAGNNSNYKEGAVFSNAANQTLTIKDSIFTDNDGGAIYAQYGGTITVQDTSITATANHNSGSAIYLEQMFYKDMSASIIAKTANVEISGYKDYGIAAYKDFVAPNLTLYAQGGNILIKNNTQGGINNVGGILTMNADSGHNITINDAISSTTGMTINADNNAGTVALNGNLENAGAISVGGGTLELGSTAVTSLANAIETNDGTVKLTGGTLTQNIAGATTITGTVTDNNATLGNITITNTGNFTDNGGAFTTADNAGTFNVNGVLIATSINNTGTLNFGGTNNNISAITGDSGVTNINSGTLWIEDGSVTQNTINLKGGNLLLSSDSVANANIVADGTTEKSGTLRLNTGSTLNGSISGTFKNNDDTALYQDGGNLTLNNVGFDSNTSSTSAAALLYTGTGSGTITGSQFVNNASLSSGNIYGGAAVFGNTGTNNITNGAFTNNSVISTGNAAWGGAIYEENVALTINGTEFKKNFAGTTSGNAGGGAIDHEGGSLTISGATFGGVDNTDPENPVSLGNSVVSNNGYAYGGAIYQTGGSLSVTDTTFTGNSATSTGNNAYGGAIYNNADSSSISGTFTNNLAKSTSTPTNKLAFGGAIANFVSGAAISGSFDNNRVESIGNSAYGGAIGSTVGLTINDTSFTNNTAVAYNNQNQETSGGRGGAIYIQAGDLTINADTQNVSISGNKASMGGGIYMGNGNVIVNAVNKDVTLENNVTAVNGGGAIYMNTADKSITLNAQGGDIYVRGNGNPGYYSFGIQSNQGDINLNASTGRIVIDDRIYAAKNLNINDGTTGIVEINNKISGATSGHTTNIKGGTLKLGAGAGTSGLGAVTFTNTPILDLQNLSAQTTTVTSISGNANLNIDIDFTGESVIADSINIYTGGQTGVITLDSIAALSSDSDIKEFSNLAILTGETSGVTLAISETLQHDTRFNGAAVETLTWDSDYSDNATFAQNVFTNTEYSETKRKKLSLDDDTHTKLSYTETITIPRHETGYTTTQDVLQALNQSTNPERKLSTDSASAVYTVGDNLGTTGAGTLTVEGVLGSELNLNGKTGFELTNAGTVLNLKNLNITGLIDETTSLLEIANETGTKANLENITVSQTITKDVITNLGELNFSGTNTINSYIGGTGTTNINGGKTTLAKLVQNTVNITAGELEVADITAAINNGGILTLKGNNENTINNYTDSESVVHAGSTVIAESLTNTGAINQAITVNETKTLTTAANLIGGTVTNGGKVELTGGALGQTITGGDITIASGEVTSTVANLGGTITNNSNLLLSGTLDKNIAGDSGVTKLNDNMTFADGAGIAGTLNFNGKAITMSGDNKTSTFNIGKINSDGTINIDVNTSGTPVSDVINITTAGSTGTITINSINEIGARGDEFTLNILQGNVGDLQLALSNAVHSQFDQAQQHNLYYVSDAYDATIDFDKISFNTAEWDRVTQKTIGVEDNTKITYATHVISDTATGVVTQKDALAFINQNTDTSAVAYRSMVTSVADKTYTVQEDLGTTGAGTLLVQGASDKTTKLDMNNKGGFVVANSGTTVTLKDINVNNVQNSDGALVNITNTGSSATLDGVTVNVKDNPENKANVISSNGSVTVKASIVNAGINNTGTLDFEGTSQADRVAGATGTTNVKGQTTIGSLVQKLVNIVTGGKLIANGDVTTGTGTGEGVVNNVANGLEIKNGTLTGNVTGSGSTDFKGTSAIADGSTVGQAITVVDGKLTTLADGLGGAVTNGGEVDLTGGTLETSITGENTTISGNVGVDDTNGLIASAVKVETGAKLTTNADKVTGAINNGGNLDLTGGDIKNAISGDGNTTISGTVTNSTGKNIGNAITVASTGNLTTAADKIGGTVENNGTTNGLTLTGGQLSQNVTGTGKAVIAGTDVSVKYGNSIAQDIEITSGNKLVNTNVSAIGGDVENNGDIQLYSQDNGKLEHNITGTGTTELNRDITVAANIDNTINIKSYTDGTGTHNANVTVESGNNFGKAGQNITVDSNNSLTMQSASDIKGNLFDNGTVELQGGTISNAISGIGAVNITGNTTNNAANTVTGAVSVAENVELAIGTSGNTFNSASSLTMGNGSTLNLQNGSADIVNDNLAVATDKIANLAMDWGDSIGNTTNINGKLNISDVDLTGTTSTTTPTSYAIATGSNLGNVVLDESVNLKTNDTSFNQVKYNSTDGTFAGARNNLVQAVNTTEDGESAIYSMSGDEPAGSLGAGVLDGGKLIVQGNGNTITGYGIEVGDGTHNAILTIKDANMKDITGDALLVKGGNTVTVMAENSDIEISGTTGNAITLNKDTNGNSIVNIEGGSHTVTIENDIISDDSGNTVNFNSGTINFNGKFDPAAAVVGGATVNRGGDDDDIDWTVTSGTLNYLQDSYLNRATNTMNLNGGTLNTVNGVVTDFALGGFTLSNDSNFYADVDLAAGKMDNFLSTPTTYTGGTLHVAGLNLISDATTDNTSIPFANSTLAGHVDYTGAQGLTALSPIYKYNVGYNSSNGNFDFARYNSGGYDGLNPAIMAAPVAAQLGGYLTQLNSYDEAFRNMDMYMLMTASQRQALKNKNKIASLDGGVLYDQTLMRQERAEGWFRPFATFEKVGLRNGPKVENIAYGTYMGGESQMYDLGHGWDGIWGAYVGYNGSHQNYDGVSIYQNGGTLGVLGMAYKGNFFTGLTINAGASGVEASTMYGNEDFAMLMAGIASKTGYNWELFNGKFIIQPSMLMSYSFVNTFDYKNAAGVNVDSDPLHAIQLQPEIKFIGNLKNGWQPYASVAMVWNIMDDTKFKANDVSLPELSVKPYVKYGVGVRKTWGERLTGFFQTYLTNGGRNGVGLQAGFTWAFGGGKNKKADEKKIQKSLNKTPELKKTEIVLNGKKVQ